MLRKIAPIIIILLILSICLTALGRYRKIKTDNLRLKQSHVESILKQEKQWILENQGIEDAFYMNGEKAGDVNPYFSCHAALGLLTTTENVQVNTDELNAVRKYLNWHIKMILETDGKMGTYRRQGDTLIYVDKADSVDAYLGAYLELLSRYFSIAKTSDGLQSWKEATILALNEIHDLMKNGVVQVSQDNDTIYFMDNVEVWKGLKDLEECIKAFPEIVVLPEDSKRLITDMREQLEVTIPEIFWDGGNSRWRITADDNKFDGKEFYPDGIAQVYPLIFAFPVGDTEAQKELYNNFTDDFEWYNVESDNRSFIWAMTGLAGAGAKDLENSEKLVKNYERRFSESERKYPLYTGDAGWICRGCGVLWEMYESKICRWFVFWE